MRALRLTALPDAILAPETVGVVLVEDLSAPLSDISRSCGGAVNVAAVAAQQGHIGLIKTSNNYDLVVTRCVIASSATMGVEIGLPTVDLTGLATSGETAFLDRDTPGRPSTILGTDTAAALPAHTAIWRGRILANHTLIIELNVRLGGNAAGVNSIMVHSNNTNAQIEGGFFWTESDPQG